MVQEAPKQPTAGCWKNTGIFPRHTLGKLYVCLLPMLFCKRPLPPTARNRAPFLMKLYSDSLLSSSGKNCVTQWIYLQHLSLTAGIYHLRRWFLISAYHFWLSALIWYSIRVDLQPASALQNPHNLLQIPCHSLYLKSFQKYTWNLLLEFSSQRSGSKFLARFS